MAVALLGASKERAFAWCVESLNSSVSAPGRDTCPIMIMKL